MSKVRQAVARDERLDRIEALEAEYVDGDDAVAKELGELYDADEAPEDSRIWNVIAQSAKSAISPGRAGRLARAGSVREPGKETDHGHDHDDEPVTCPGDLERGD